MAVHEVSPLDMRVGSIYKLTRGHPLASGYESFLVKVVDTSGLPKTVTVARLVNGKFGAPEPVALNILPRDREMRVFSNANEAAGEVSGQGVLSTESSPEVPKDKTLPPPPRSFMGRLLGRRGGTSRSLRRRQTRRRRGVSRRRR